MAHKNNSENPLEALPPEYEQIDRRISNGDYGWVLDLSGEDGAALRLARRRDGYLKCPAGPCLLLQAVYLSLRELRGLTGVMLRPSSEERWRISAICFDPGRFADMRKTAEEVGVEVDAAQTDVGGLTGWVDADRADFAAWRLGLMRIGPDLTSSLLSVSAGRNGRHRPSSKGDDEEAASALNEFNRSTR